MYADKHISVRFVAHFNAGKQIAAPLSHSRRSVRVVRTAVYAARKNGDSAGLLDKLLKLERDGEVDFFFNRAVPARSVINAAM